MGKKKPKKYKALVVVESPAKAKKIGGYLGSDYHVQASVGHVRDLPAGASEIPEDIKKEKWSRLGVNVEKNFEPLYVVSDRGKSVLRDLKRALKESEELIIATDEDREGESIGWHLVQLLDPKVPVKRMVFSEITKKAIQDAINSPRDMDENLVSAQETRRVVDRLYGYPLSELLWKKVAPKLSAGRVQSVAVRLLVERERERAAFHSAIYWDLKAELAGDEKATATFGAMLSTVGGQRVASGKDFDENTGKLKEGSKVLLLGEEQAADLLKRIKEEPWSVANIEEKQQTRKPAAPFITSSLQQEANRKLNMTARETMRVAQTLYEGGHITYMRTDSTNLSQEAIDAARGCVQTRYGDDYLSPSPRQYAGKVRNAQEAHEAIRPAGTDMNTADEIGLTGREAKLYDLVWKRTVASQMAEARLRFQTVTITAADAEFRATGRHVDFPGFFRAYVEGSDDPEAALEDRDDDLPPLKEGQSLDCRDLEALSHETKPPARFTEASLVRRLEEAGVGRPSTYASILDTIQRRGYVQKNGSQLVPTFTAMAVTKLLEKNFPNLVNPQFTARMEEDLDLIAEGKADRLQYLTDFYCGNDGLEQQIEQKQESIDRVEARTLQFSDLEPNVRLGRYGWYFEQGEGDDRVTVSVPDGVAPADLTNDIAKEQIERKQAEPESLGTHPEHELPIYLKVGPYGHYLQLGEQGEDGKKPKRTGLPKTVPPEDVDFEKACKLLELPKRLGRHPETNKVVNVGIGMYGPYVLYDKKYGNFDRKTHTYEFEGKTYDVLTVTLDCALHMIANAKKRGAPDPVRVVGNHPEDDQPIGIYDGKYGHYVKHGKINATIPKDRKIEEVTLDEAVKMIAAKAEQKGVKKGTKRKKATKKKATKKKAAKKKKVTKTSAAKKKKKS